MDTAMNIPIRDVEQKLSFWYNMNIRLFLVDRRPNVPAYNAPMPWFIPSSVEIAVSLTSTSTEIEWNYWAWHFKGKVEFGPNMVIVEVIDKKPLDEPIIYSEEFISQLIQMAARYKEDISKYAIPDFRKIRMGQRDPNNKQKRPKDSRSFEETIEGVKEAIEHGDIIPMN